MKNKEIGNNSLGSLLLLFAVVCVLLLPYAVGAFFDASLRLHDRVCSVRA